MEKEKPESILAMEVKDFLIEMVVTWSTTVEKETSASWALNSNILINKACTYMYAQTYTTYTYTYTHIHTNVYTHTFVYTHTRTHAVTCIHTTNLGKQSLSYART